MPPLLKQVLLPLNVDNLATIIVTASFADAVGQMVCAAIGAGNNTGRLELPVRVTSFVSSRL